MPDILQVPVYDRIAVRRYDQAFPDSLVPPRVLNLPIEAKSFSYQLSRYAYSMGELTDVLNHLGNDAGIPELARANPVPLKVLTEPSFLTLLKKFGITQVIEDRYGLEERITFIVRKVWPEGYLGVSIPETHHPKKQKAPDSTLPVEIVDGPERMVD